ncbi:hypothetical protein TESG_04009 [Trichophyton tonsurans CBS 112818]|uniref:Uncharacterized protein n=1 Tax=Trichophyton tonsurans (strain CBS 112818) TaxID=647933 RepID=F2RZ23_TRIT1|nr:hypothetical protein TESG_04009 [Trichophyton tonsurans CBS 112818]
MGALGGREIEPVQRGLTTQQRWASKPSIVTRSSRGYVWPSAAAAAVAVAADAAASAWADDGYEVSALGVAAGGRLDVVRDAAEERAPVPAHVAVILDIVAVALRGALAYGSWRASRSLVKRSASSAALQQRPCQPTCDNAVVVRLSAAADQRNSPQEYSCVYLLAGGFE